MNIRGGLVGNNTESFASITRCPSNPCYIGNNSDSTQGFKGCIDEVRLYEGADSKEHVKAEYNKNTYPTQWKYDYKKVTVNVGSGGFAHYDLIYADIIDVEPPDTTNSGNTKIFELPFDYNYY